jgi:hypothetical protein
MIYSGTIDVYGRLAKVKASPGGVGDAEKLGHTLLALGADEFGVKRLTSSKHLDHVVIPVYWKDGLVSSVRPLWLLKLPEFVKSFESEFPDGQIRWDQDYEGSDPFWGDIALRVYFNYQEDDQGDHWSPPPTLLEEESYYRMLSVAAFKGEKPIPAARVVHGK